MRLNISICKIVYFIWVFSANAKQLVKNDDSFEPATQQPIKYFPQQRIVGGQDAKDNQYPYQISLRFFNTHICGGSIVSKNYILTAAHCVSTGSEDSMKKIPTSYLSIRAGSRIVNTGGVVVDVSEIIVHPNYKNFNNDIAVLKLGKPLVFSASIKAIALASQRPKTGVEIISSGWGRLRTAGASPTILQYNSLVTISNAECIRRIGYVPTSLICLGHSAGNGVCSGDSGGPAVLNDELIGVTNFVVGDCGSNAPDGYASVAYFANWIRSVTDI